MKPTILCMILLAACSLVAQELHVTGRRTSTLRNIAYAGPAKSNGDGDVFFIPGANNLGHNRLIELRHDGKDVRTFDLSTVPGHEKAPIHDFFPAPDGELLVLTSGGGGTSWVIRFDKDGTLAGQIQLQDWNFIPLQLAAFSNGDLLVAGSTYSQEDMHRAPALAVFDTSGRKIASVKNPNDVREAPPVKDKDGGQKSSLVHVLGSSMAESGDDGNVYLVRGLQEAPVFVISARGMVVRRLFLKAPSAQAMLMSFKVRHRRLAALYWEKEEGTKFGAGRTTIIVLDATNGEEVARYRAADPEMGTALVGFDGDDFELLTSNGAGFVEIQTARPQ